MPVSSENNRDPQQARIDKLEAKVAAQESEINALKGQVGERDSYIAEIGRSRAWRLVQRLWQVRLRIVPPGSRRECLLNLWRRGQRKLHTEGLVGFSFKLLGRLFRTRPGQAFIRVGAHLLPRRLREYLDAFGQEYPLRDRSLVILYAPPSYLPAYPQRFSLNTDTASPLASAPSQKATKVSLISTVYNEADHAQAWLASLMEQSRLPDEVVITDGGSTDRTVEIIRQFAQSAPVEVRVLEAPGATIARGRNIAIQNARYPVIACTDCHSTLDRRWLEYLLLPFETDERIQVSAGNYQSILRSRFQRLISPFFVRHPDTLDPQSFMPSSRSVAFTKNLWARIGGYPEWLSDAGEDTLFDYNLKNQPAYWAFSSQAMAAWQPPSDLRKWLKKVYRYAKGDGEIGTYANIYVKVVQNLLVKILALGCLVLVLLAGLFLSPWFLALLAAGVIFALLILARNLHSIQRKTGLNLPDSTLHLGLFQLALVSQLAGFMSGLANRERVRQLEARRYQEQLQQILDRYPQRKGVIVYPPTHDWGFMFQLPQQMARVFARKGYLYFYCTNNDKTDTVIGFQEAETRLILSHVPMETFRRLPNPIVYIGSPWNHNLLQHFNQPRVIYDHYDDLQVSAGRMEDHQALLKEADVVLVTAGRLLDNVQDLRPDTIFIPNGVDYAYLQDFRPQPDEPPPTDWLPVTESHKPIIGYSGALGERVDYELLRYLAAHRSDLEFVLIGVNYDGSLERSGLLSSGLCNLHWLGMKPYDELFRYMWHFDVGIVPFKINEITLATTSIKLFEYMACQVPVISTAIPESKRYAGVLIAETYEQFVEHLDTALKLGDDLTYLMTIQQVAQANSWERRVDAVIARLAELETQDPSRKSNE